MNCTQRIRNAKYSTTYVTGDYQMTDHQKEKSDKRQKTLIRMKMRVKEKEKRNTDHGNKIIYRHTNEKKS